MKASRVDFYLVSRIYVNVRSLSGTFPISDIDQCIMKQYRVKLNSKCRTNKPWGHMSVYRTGSEIKRISKITGRRYESL